MPTQAEIEAATRAFFGLEGADRFTALEYVEFTRKMRAALEAAERVRKPKADPSGS